MGTSERRSLVLTERSPIQIALLIALTLVYITVSFFHPSPMDYAMSNVFTFIYLSSALPKSSNRVKATQGNKDLTGALNIRQTFLALTTERLSQSSSLPSRGI